MTGHRAYFRSRADFAIKWQQKDVGSFVSQHPCDQYSRWRNYPFTGAGDFAAKVNVVPYGDKFLLIVYSELQHGAKVREVRGVIDRFYASNDAGNTDYSGAGWYLTGYGMGEGAGQQVRRLTLEIPLKMIYCTDICSLFFPFYLFILKCTGLVCK